MQSIAGVKAETKTLNALVKRVEEGDKSALSELREALATRPDIWQNYGNLADNIREVALRFQLKDTRMAESVRLYMQQLETEIAGSSPSLLESLLARRIALCWFHVHIAEGLYAEAVNAGKERRIDYTQKSLQRAQSMYLKAIKALAQVRGMKIPAIQLNIGGQQVNMAGGIQDNIRAGAPDAPERIPDRC